MNSEESVQGIIEQIEELKEDTTLPKSLNLKLDHIIGLLSKDENISIKIDKVLNELDDLTCDANLPPYTRTQLWNIVSLLETM
jgi:uncharacterized protein (UPF0147 family)